MRLDSMTFDELRRFFFDTRANMAISVGVSPTTLRKWEDMRELGREERSRILGAALLDKTIPAGWLSQFSAERNRPEGAFNARQAPF